MANATAELEKEAAAIRERIEPKRQEIRDDEQQLARLEAALEILKGNTLVARSRTAPARRTRGSIDEAAIVAYVRKNPNASAGDISTVAGASGNTLSVKLGRMVKAGVLTKTGERANTRYSAA
jgi:Fic family protein